VRSTGATGEGREGLKELASGVDALYLSGRADLSDEVVWRLEAGRLEAETHGNGLPMKFGGEEVRIQSHGFGKYRYCLMHPYGQIGITRSQKLPALRVQPRAEFLHGVGAGSTVSWFRNLLESECGPVLFTVSRLDIHADFQGWMPDGDDRRRFVCRGTSRATYEESEEFNGFQFGKRGSGTVSARIYNKTEESDKKGSSYWKDIWGAAYDPETPVLRIEFEVGREGLRQYELNAPEEVLGAVGALWVDLTSSWLSYRTPSSDNTKSRWAVAPEWLDVCRARIADDAFGVERMFEGRRRGELSNLAPALIGYLSNVAALTKGGSLEDAMRTTAGLVRWYGHVSGRSFEVRAAEKRLEYGLP
jgi:hypothetical protein